MRQRAFTGRGCPAPPEVDNPSPHQRPAWIGQRRYIRPEENPLFLPGPPSAAEFGRSAST